MLWDMHNCQLEIIKYMEFDLKGMISGDAKSSVKHAQYPYCHLVVKAPAGGPEQSYLLTYSGICMWRAM